MAAKKSKPAPVVDTPAADPAPPTRAKYFIIAENRALAAATAEKDWGWPKTKTGWTDPEGNPVKFLADIDAVTDAATKGPVVLYEGYRWYAVIAPHHLDALKKSHAVQSVVVPNAPKPE